MRHKSADRNRPVLDDLHPLVYAAMVGLAAWFVLAMWLLFGGGAYTELIFAVVTGFFVMLVAIPLALWTTWRNNSGAETSKRDRPSLRRWASGTFRTWTGPQKASQAIVEILLPLAAVAFGLTAIGLVYFIESHALA